MANTGFLSVSEVSFDGIKSNLKNFLKAKTEFQDYDFEGSNLSALLDLLSYNTYLNSYYLNMVGSEMFLDSSQIKSSVVSHAKELNYVPRSRTSARAKVQFTINTGNETPNFVLIPKGYACKAVVDGTKLEYSTLEPIVVLPDSTGVYTSDYVYIYEGKQVTEYFTVDGVTKYVLQSENIDTNSIEVTVINSSTDSTNSIYSVAESLYGLNPNSKAYFIQGYESNQYEIVFGDDVTGKSLVNGNIVKVFYRSCSGEQGNKVSYFEPSYDIEGKYPVVVSTIIAASDGSEREDTDEIKFHAPRFFTTQNRAVTRDDYINLIKQKFPQIKTVNVYGGEEADPPQYGKAIVTMIPFGSSPIVSDELKTEISNYLLTKTITTEPIIKDPEYLYAEVISAVSFNPLLSNKSVTQLRTDIINKIKDYDSMYLVNFGDDIRHSKLSAMIDSADAAVVGNDTQLRAIYKIAPRKTVKTRVDFTFSNQLFKPAAAYVPGQTETIKSNAFTYIKNNSGYQAFISDDGVGNLRIYYSTPLNPVIILESNIGTVNYDTGVLSFDINAYDYNGTIDLYARLNSPDITVKESKFLKIDFSKISVNINTNV
jgi:hypothetical protein